MEVHDRKRFEEKLKDYQRVQVGDLKAGDHCRYVKKNYNSETYKCVYCIVDSNDDGQDISVHGYVPQNSTEPPYSWVITRKSVPYMRFYKKVKK